MFPSFKARAPGSVMLLGEYAVLYGKTAIVCAIDKFISVTLTPRFDEKIILSSALGKYETDIKNLKIEFPFQFILTILKKFQKNLTSGCHIEVNAEFSNQIGLASSASVTVATLAALSSWLGFSFSKLELSKEARSIVREVQGVGSGADVFASVFGGVIHYHARKSFIEELPADFFITAIYSGNKVPTVEAIKRVNHFFYNKSFLFKKIMVAIDECAHEGKKAICAKDWSHLGHIMNVQQGLLEAIGVNTETLQTIITALKKERNILGAKISGSGFGDCVIGLGEVNDLNFKEGVRIPLAISKQGVICEKI